MIIPNFKELLKQMRHIIKKVKKGNKHITNRKARRRSEFDNPLNIVRENSKRGLNNDKYVLYVLLTETKTY
jgi:hypothetical protein